MPDATRAKMTRLIYRRLTDPSFRQCLTATDREGARPIIVALREDPMRELVENVYHAGGCANVVVPALNGFMVVEMAVGRSDAPVPGAEDLQELDRDCTVGLFVARLRVDDVGASYLLAVEEAGGPPPHHSLPPARGRAKVVALGS